MRGGWNDERDALLRREFAKGTSSSCIAALFPGGIFSRNAVIGRLHRLGLRRNPHREGKNKWMNQEPSPRKRRSARGPKNGFNFGRGYQGDDLVTGPIDTTPLDIDPASGDRVSLEQLTKITCRWPLGDPSDHDFGFCGAKPHESLPYCLAHARVGYETPQQRAKRSKQNGGTAIDATTGSWR